MKNKDRPEVQKACTDYWLTGFGTNIQDVLEPYGYDNSLRIDDWLNEEYIPFTAFEKELLSHFDKKYHWITRDSLGNLFVYVNKPYRNDFYWLSDSYHSDIPDGDYFQSIKWSDAEPVCIDDIVKRG